MFRKRQSSLPLILPGLAGSMLKKSNWKRWLILKSSFVNLWAHRWRSPSAVLDPLPWLDRLRLLEPSRSYWGFSIRDALEPEEHFSITNIRTRSTSCGCRCYACPPKGQQHRPRHRWWCGPSQFALHGRCPRGRPRPRWGGSSASWRCWWTEEQLVLFAWGQVVLYPVCVLMCGGTLYRRLLIHQRVHDWAKLLAYKKKKQSKYVEQRLTEL